MEVSIVVSEENDSNTRLLCHPSVSRNSNEKSALNTKAQKPGLLSKPYQLLDGSKKVSSMSTLLPSARQITCPWSLFTPSELIRATLDHRLYYKALRYLEYDVAANVPKDLMKDKGLPGTSILANISLNNEPLSPPSTIVNALAQQYSRADMQCSVAGLFNSVKVSVDATAYELLQWWPGAMQAYKKKMTIKQIDKQEQQELQNRDQKKLKDQRNDSIAETPAVWEFLPRTGSTNCGGEYNNINFGFNVSSDTPHQANAHFFHVVSNNTSKECIDNGIDTILQSSASSDFHILHINDSKCADTTQPDIAQQQQHFQPLSSSRTGSPPPPALSLAAASSLQPDINIKDIRGYLRTFCFCGMWEGGLQFALENFDVIKNAEAIAKGSRGGKNSTSHHYSQSRSIANNAFLDLSSIYASMCAVIMHSWDDVKMFAEIMTDKTTKLLFLQLSLAQREAELISCDRTVSNSAGIVASRDKFPLSGINSNINNTTINDLTTINANLEKNLHKALVAIDEDLKRTLPLSYSHSYDVIMKLQHFQEIQEARLYRRPDTMPTLRRTIRAMWFQRFQSMRPDALTMLFSVIIYSLAATPREITDVIYHFSKAVRVTHPRLGTWAMRSLQANALQQNKSFTTGGGGSGIEGGEVSEINSPTTMTYGLGLGSTCNSEIIDNEEMVSGSFGNLRMSSVGLGRDMDGEEKGGRPSSFTIALKDSLVTNLQKKDVLIDYCEHLWSTGECSKAIRGLKSFLDSPATTSVLSMSSPEAVVRSNGLKDIGFAHVLLGIWKQDLLPDRFWQKGNREEILQHLKTAVELLPQEYIAWHSWGLINHRIQQHDSRLMESERALYINSAHSGFVAAIQRAKRSSFAIQDVMRLLQIWLIYRGISTLGEKIMDAIYCIPASLWCVCIPQIVAHLGSKKQAVWNVVRTILEKTCAAYPQQCVYHLLLPILSDPYGVGTRIRPTRAQVILNSSCPPQLYQETKQVAQGLVELALFPVESIFDHIGQTLKTIRTVESLPTIRQRDTMVSFANAAMDVAIKNRDVLAQVGDVCSVLNGLLKYLEKACTSLSAFKQTIEYCNQLYVELQEHVKNIRKVDLKKSKSPLGHLRELSAWVPGDYDPDVLNPSTIFAFIERVDVIESKRRPRRFKIVGSDGVINTFCLKGNEDLRVDTRAMQLFVLLNTFNDSRDEAIVRIPVLPLSESVGVLGWVEDSETLYSIIHDFRVCSGLSQESEVSILANECCNVSEYRFHRLQGIHKAELFEHLFKTAPCDDMALIFWYRSVNAELWLRRRCKFTSILAKMSTAGYILGLGDRHPGNLLVQMNSGALVHIDFGDCFDVTRYRTSYPETIPFRLTPMLVNSMEVFGVSGLFQHVCDSSMRSMRTNRDSILALLSSFVYDPVIDKRISQKSRRGCPINVIESVRKKLRGVEMPYYMYPQNEESLCWDSPMTADRPRNHNQQYSNGTKTKSENFNINKQQHHYTCKDAAFYENGFVVAQSPPSDPGAETATAATFAHQQKNCQQQQPQLRQVRDYTHTTNYKNNDNNINEEDDVPDAATTAAVIDALSSSFERMDGECDQDNDNNIDDEDDENVIEERLKMRADLQFVLSQDASEKQMRHAGIQRKGLSVKEQVRVLIKEATSVANLSEVFPGWTPWW